MTWLLVKHSLHVTTLVEQSLCHDTFTIIKSSLYLRGEGWYNLRWRYVLEWRRFHRVFPWLLDTIFTQSRKNNWCFCWLIDCTMFYVPLGNNSFISRRYHCWQRAAQFSPILGVIAFEQGRFFIVPHLLWHGASFFSSPEPKAQVSFSDQNLSVVRRCRLRRKLFTCSSSSPEPLGQFQPNLAQSILG